MNTTTYGATDSAVPVLSIAPVVLPAPNRAVDLHVRVSMPTTGSALPIILLSHGLGLSNHLSSLNGYGPLANFWAARGYIVIAPTHLDSKTLHAGADGPATPRDVRSERGVHRFRKLVLSECPALIYVEMGDALP